MVRKVIIVSGTRADYGIYKPVASELIKAGFDVSFLVCGMHLAHKYGYSVQHIERDGFDIIGRIDSLFLESSKENMGKTLSLELAYFSQILASQQPEYLMLLGDRGEMLAGAIAGAYLGIKTVHLHGGEVSGTVDESIRHAVSKLSSIHFTSTLKSQERLIRLGEDSWRVYQVGAPRIDTILNEELPDFEVVKKQYGLDIESKNYILLVFHPVVTETDSLFEQMIELTKALNYMNQKIICILPNADVGGETIREFYEQSDLLDIVYVSNFSPEEYLTILAHSMLMVGNSSSGIIEAASFHIPVINIGTRQNGREQSDNTIDADSTFDSIIAAYKIIQSQPFQEKLQISSNIYGDGCACERIVQTLKALPDEYSWVQKKITY